MTARKTQAARGVPYDYVAVLARLSGPAGFVYDDPKVRRVLRKLVRDAVKASLIDQFGEDEMHDFTGTAMWDRIAKALVP